MLSQNIITFTFNTTIHTTDVDGSSKFLDEVLYDLGFSRDFPLILGNPLNVALSTLNSREAPKQGSFSVKKK